MNRKYFILILLALFTLELLGPVQEWVVQPFTQGLAGISAYLVQAFDSSAISEGVVLRSLSNGVAVAIQPSCNGIEAMICLTAAIIAYPAKWSERIMGLLLGYLAIQL